MCILGVTVLWSTISSVLRPNQLFLNTFLNHISRYYWPDFLSILHRTPLSRGAYQVPWEFLYDAKPSTQISQGHPK